MDRLDFVCNWKEDKKATWSGTCWGLRKGLEKYFEINDIEINKLGSRNKLLNKIKNRLLRLVKKGGPLNASETKRLDKKIREKYQLGENAIIQFSEAPYLVNERQYIYLDLSVSVIRQLMETDKEIYEICGFPKCQLNEIRCREEYQNDFLKKIAGIFVMGNWIKKEIIKINKLDSNKVHVVGGV